MKKNTNPTFGGYSTEGLAFLTQLGESNKDWFTANKAAYDDLVAQPTKALVSALGERLAEEISPTIVAQPKTNGSIAPINNDLRFSPDKSPYKDHLLLRFWDPGPVGLDKKVAPTLFVRVSEDEIGFAAGAAITSTDRWRSTIDGAQGEALADALKALGKGRQLDVAGAELKNVPKPYDAEHPRADLLKHKRGFQARWPEPTPASIQKASFVDWCLRRLRDCGEVHHWLVRHG